MIYVGIDPGKQGAMASIDGSGNVTICRFSGKSTTDVVKHIQTFFFLEFETCVMLEKVHAMPRQGVSSSFTFGEGYGVLQAALIASDVGFDYVTPQVWQKAVAKVPKSENKQEHKKNLRAVAQRLYPKVDIHLEAADAVLIAEFCRRVATGVLV